MSIPQCLQGTIALYKMIFLILFIPIFSHAQVRLNEVSGDSGNNDSTNDGIVELAGAAGTDISCYVISNSEWTVILPPNTKIPADGVFLIACSEGKNIGNNPNPVVGSGLTCALCDFPNMPLDFDVCNPINAAYIDWAASGFTIDNAAMTDGDQIVLFSPNGTVLDAVQWGGGSTNIPTDNTTLSASRGNQSYTIGNATWNGEGNPALPPVALKMGGTCFQSGINYVMPAISSGKYTDLTNLSAIKSINSDVLKGCNSSFMFDAVTNKWVKTDHPNPGFPTNTPHDDFIITGNVTQCTNALSPITVTWKVLNWQSVEESTVNDFGRIGSFWQEEGTGISNAWTSISRNNVTGITTLTYTFTPSVTTTYNFVWQDRVEHTIASSENGSGLIGAVVSGSTLSDCYDVKTINVKVADPMAATQTTITCPTDNPKGTINLANFVTGGLTLNYKLFANGVEISSNNTGVFSLPTSLAIPIKAVVSDASGCSLPVTIVIDASCRQAPICPNTIVTMGSTPSGSLCVDDEISLCMSGINLPAGGSVQWYYSTTAATFSPASGILIGNADIPNPTTGTTIGHPGGGVCPVIDGIMVDACNGSTTEKDNEFLILRNSSAALNVDDIGINLPSSTDIKTTANNEFAPYAGVNSPLGGCFTIIDDGATIPADAVVIIFMSNLLSQTYDFTSLCAAYGTVYVLFRNPSTAAFTNSAKAIRNTILSVKNNPTCTATYTYQNAAKPSSGTTDGTFYRFPLPLVGKTTTSTALNNGCSAPPVTTAPATPPCVNFTIPAALCGNSNVYIRPLITPVDATCPSRSNTTAALTYTLSCPKANIAGNMTVCTPNTGSATITVTNGVPNKNITGKIIRASDAVTTNFIGSTNASGNAIITVNGLATGDYELNMMTISGSSCPVQFSGVASVKVNPSPNITFSNTTTNVCQGLLAAIPIMTTGTLPFDIVYHLNGGANTKLSVFSTTLYIPIPSGMTGMVTLNVASISDETGCAGTITGTGKINIIAPPTAPIGTNSENCWSSGTTNFTFTTNAGANTINWYDVPIGGALLGTENTFSMSGFTPTAPFPQIITRYAETVDVATGCISTTRTPITVTIQQKPSVTLEKSDPTCAAPSSGSIKITAIPTICTYNYQKAATYTTGVLSPNAALVSPMQMNNMDGGDYTVRVLNTNTCFSDKSIALSTPIGCFTCPTIGAVSGVNMVCKGKPITLTVSGLIDMAMAKNGETDFGIKFVYFASQKTGNTMYNTPDGTLGTVPFAQIVSGNAVLNNAILPATTGIYYIYAILEPVPTTSASCRPYKELLIKVNDASAPLVNNEMLCQNNSVVITPNPTQPISIAYNFDAQSLSPIKSGTGAVHITGFDVGLGGGIIAASSGLYQIGNPSSGFSMVSQGFTVNGTADDAITNNDFIEFVVGGKDGYSINSTNIEFDTRRSGTGPTNFEIRTSNDLFTNIVGTGTVPTTFGASPMRTFAVNLPIAVAGTSIRIYPHGATSAIGTFRVDNVKITSTVRATATYHIYSDVALTTKIADQISSFTFNNTAIAGDKKIWTTCISPQGCVSPATESTITINPLPIVNNASLTLCEAVVGSKKAIFTLSNANLSIATGNTTIAYFASLADAQANFSPLSNTYNSISKKIYARIIDNVTSCLNFSELQLNAIPRANAGIAPPSITLCVNGKPVDLFSLLSGSPTTNGSWSGASALLGGHLGTCDPTKIVEGIYTYTVKGTPPCPDATTQIEIKIMPTALACSGGINAALPSTGTLQITPQMVVHGNYPDYSLFKVDVFDKNGNLLPNAMVTKEQAGTKINIQITNTCSNGICNISVLLEDKTKPICEKLMDYTLPCTVDIATAKPTPSDFKVEPLDADSVRQDRSTYNKDFTGLYIFKGEVKPTKVKISVVGGAGDDVIFTDNAGIYSIYFIDLVEDYGCAGKTGNSTILKEITRQWRIVDINGNVQLCSQIIAIQAVTNTDCPTDVTVEYDDADLALKITPVGGENKEGDKVKGAGAPFIDSNKNHVKDTYREPYIYPENKAIMCKITASYVDKRYNLCKNSYKIIRTWQVLNECTKTISTCSQTISVLDTKPPEITADEKKTILDTDGNECAYIGKLNFFNIADKSGIKYDETHISVKNTVTGKTNLFINDGLSRLARGTWEIIVTAKDSCGNIASKTFERTVRDRQAPSMVCQDNIKISLNNLSVTNICARTFNHASRDNCSDIQFKVAKSETQNIDFQKLTYKDCLDFSCEEVGNPPFIFLRGMDADSNLNYCMVKMQVEDKIPPTCSAPADMKMSCGEYRQLKNSGEWNERKWRELFGSFKYFEACDADISEKIEEKLSSGCTAGELLRTFTVTERYGAKRSATCTQRIEITPKQDFVVVFPFNKNVACAEPPKEKPRVVSNGCENVQITYKDEIFRSASQVFDNQSGKYCYKIVRHWSAINMCRYSPTRFNYLPEGDADAIYTDKLKDTIFYGKYWIDDIGTEANDNALHTLKNDVYSPLRDVTNNTVFANKTDKPYLSFYQNLINGTRKFGAIIDGKTDSTAIQIRDYSGDGMIRYTQIINIIDNETPVFAACPKEIIEAGTGESFDNDCTADASLSVIATDKCTPSDSIQYSFVIKLYGKNQENMLINGKKKHFSGKLPITKSDDTPHEITWSAQDICGNIATCTYKFRVSDKKSPTILTQNIYTQVMDKETVTIPVSKFVLSASDNCTPQNRLRFSFSPDVKDTLKILTCSDIPSIKVKIYVTDESKNQNFSTSNINLIDGNSPKVCDPERDLIVTGAIITESNLAVQASINLSMDNEQSAAFKTEQKEAFSWHVPRRKNYFLTPKRTGDWMNGVSTFDLVLMQKHILDIEKLSSPYKIIAADINNDHRLTTLDIIELRKNILKISNGFQNNTSWRFIQKNYAFKDAENPLDELIPEQYRFPTLEKDIKADFIAIKIGDVSDNAYGNFPENRIVNVEERGGEAPMSFFIEDKTIRKGELVTVLFKADEMRTLAGFQMDLQFDKTVFQFEKLISHSLSLTERNFGTFDRAITMSWHDAKGVNIGKGEVLFALVFTATHDTRLREALWSSKNFIKSEAYIVEKNVPIVVPLLLEIQEDATLRNENSLHQNTPNPFKNETTLHFYLTEPQLVTIRITNATSKNMTTIQKYYDKGENEVLLQDFPDVGVYFYHLETASYRATRKMVKVR